VSPLPLEKFVLPDPSPAHSVDAVIAERLWRVQFPETARWQLIAPLQPAFHFTLLSIVRCQIQAIDQHWSLHRMAVSLSDGEADDALHREIGFCQKSAESVPEIPWPASDIPWWRQLLEQVLQQELTSTLSSIRARQENSLRRELDRIDEYFQSYGREL